MSLKFGQPVRFTKLYVREEGENEENLCIRHWKLVETKERFGIVIGKRTIFNITFTDEAPIKTKSIPAYQVAFDLYREPALVAEEYITVVETLADKNPYANG